MTIDPGTPSGPHAVEIVDGYRAFVPHGPWSPSLDADFRRTKAQALYLNYALGFSSDDLEFLRDYPFLEGLKVLVRDKPLDLAPLHVLHNLRSFSLDVYGKSPIDFAAYPLLERAFVMWRPGAATVFECPLLRDLYTSGFPEAAFNHAGQLEAMTKLQLGNTQVASLAWLTELTSLSFLGLYLLAKLKELPEIPTLETLELRKCMALSDLCSLSASGQVPRSGVNSVEFSQRR